MAGASVSTSPLPFSAMAGQCEALGTDSRKKLSTWLSHANSDTKPADTGAAHGVQNPNVIKVSLYKNFSLSSTNGSHHLTYSFIDSG